MADISTINGVSIDNVSKIDDIAKASITDVNNVLVPTPPAGGADEEVILVVLSS